MFSLPIRSFVASWLLLCLISPLCNGAEESYSASYEVDDPANHQFQQLQSEIASKVRANIPERPERSYYDYHQPNAVHSAILSKNPDVHVKSNVKAKSVPEYLVQEQYKSRYGSSESRHENQWSVKKESDIRFPHYEETRRKDEEITKKMNALDKLLSENSDENNVESRNTIEDRSVAETTIPEETKRVVRQVRKQRPGFFWTLARLAFEVRMSLMYLEII